MKSYQLLLAGAIGLLCLFACEPKASNKSHTSTPKDTVSCDSIWKDSIVQEEYIEESVFEIMERTVDAKQLGIRLHPKDDYQVGLQKIKAQKAKFAQRYRNADNQASRNMVLDEAGIYLESELLNHVFPSWYGTTWAYEGHTDTPMVGEIACGYLVSTSLKHVGFNLNRYKLAQQAGSTGCRTLSAGDKVYKLYKKDTTEITQFFKDNLEEGLYHVALAYHVGFVLYRQERLYFIHSSFFYPGTAIIEPIEQSPGFESSLYLFNRISTNRKLIRKWLLNEFIEIQKA